MIQHEVEVWDPFVRVFHWALVALFIIAYMTEDEWLGLHVYAGYVIGVLLALRVGWGLVGPHHARFGDFVYPVDAITAYLRDTLRLRARRYLGHNPAGGAMVVLMLTVLLLTTLSGLLAYGIEGQGPLAAARGPWAGLEDVAEGLHELLANLAVFLVVVHVGGVIVESLIHGENLAKSMLTGRKRAE